MLEDDPSNPSHESPHQAWLAYLDRMGTPDASLHKGPLQVGEPGEWASCLQAGQPDLGSSGLGSSGSGQSLSQELLGEEEFCAMLTLLDELCLREIEGRLSTDQRDQMDELRLVLLGELDEAIEEDALLPDATPRPTALHGGSPRRPVEDTSGARNRRHLWRQNRRGPR